MPKLPALKDKDLIRVLRQLGFAEHRRHGTSHRVFKHADGRRTTVALHAGKDVPRGTLGGILRDVGITPGEFLEVLKN